MAWLLHHHMSLAIFLMLLLASLAVAPADAAADTPAKKIGMRFRKANKEESQWLDRYAETHQPLGAGPLRMVRATPEEEHWLNRFNTDPASESHDGEDGSGGSHLVFDEDNPYLHALRAWVARLAKQSMDPAENPFKDL